MPKLMFCPFMANCLWSSLKSHWGSSPIKYNWHRNLKREKDHPYSAGANAAAVTIFSFFPGWIFLYVVFIHYLFFFFFGCTYGMYDFLGQGSYLSHSSDPGHSSDNTRSLTHWATRELLYTLSLCLALSSAFSPDMHQHISILLHNIHNLLNSYVIFHGCVTPFPGVGYFKCLSILNISAVSSIKILEFSCRQLSHGHGETGLLLGVKQSSRSLIRLDWCAGFPKYCYHLDNENKPFEIFWRTRYKVWKCPEGDSIKNQLVMKWRFPHMLISKEYSSSCTL